MALPAEYAVRLAGSVLQTLGLFLTAWRICIRIQIRRFWWEDAWAATLLFVGPVFIITQWIFLLTRGLTSIIAQWTFLICYTSIVTLARMSLLFSIIRTIHGNSRLLNFTYACAAFFGICWVVLIIEKVVQCTSSTSWHNRVCLLKAYITVFQFTASCVAVAILVVLPLRILWRIKLPRRKRRMILSVFASSVVLAFGALFHTIGQILNVSMIMAAGINVEVALSLCVCNLLVVITYAYRLLLPDGRDDVVFTTSVDDMDPSTSGGDADDDFTTRLARRPMTAQVTSLTLTTVDLDAPTASDH